MDKTIYIKTKTGVMQQNCFDLIVIGDYNAYHLVTDNIKFYDSDSGGYYTLVFTGGIVTFCGWSTS